MNKVETMVTARWAIWESKFFSHEEKKLIFEKLKNKISAEGYLQVSAQESRSQLDNKERAIQKLLELVDKALFVPQKDSKQNQQSLLKKKKAKIRKNSIPRKRRTENSECRDIITISISLSKSQIPNFIFPIFAKIK